MKTARMKSFRKSRMEEIVKHLGRKPRDVQEYRKVYRYIFGDMAGEEGNTMKVMRRRHLAHTGPASIKRQYCIFCETNKI